MKYPNNIDACDRKKDYGYLKDREINANSLKLTEIEKEIKKNKLKSKNINIDSYLKFIATI